MTRGKRILSIVGASLALLVLLAVITSVLVMRTEWFRNYVREKIVAVTEQSTGGRVEIQSFDFDWKRLEATVRGFVLHGTEPPGHKPLFRAETIRLRLKLLAGLRRAVDLEYLGVQKPRANVIVLANGQTNIPVPKVVAEKPNGSGLKSVVDLAVRKFEITDGMIYFSHLQSGFSVRGENLRAQLGYNAMTPEYKGQIAISPLTLQSGKEPPLQVNVIVPVRIGRDKVEVSNGKLLTSESGITLDGKLEHMAAPRLSAHVTARVSLAEVARTTGVALHPNDKGAPSVAQADVAVQMDEQAIRISKAQLNLGRTSLTASGPLKQPSPGGSLEFAGSLALDELSKLLKLAVQPRGTVELAGNARFNGGSDYLVTGRIDTKNLTIRQGSLRLDHLGLSTAVKADAHVIALEKLRLSALGGEFTGNATLEELRRLRLSGQFHHFEITQLAQTLAGKPTGYDGTISGPLQADGDLNAKATSGIDATTRLTITPGRRGVPVAGLIDASYSGASRLVNLKPSSITLPNSRLDVSGTLAKEIDLRFVSRNLDDLLPAIALGSSKAMNELPAKLNGGSANLEAAITGKLDAPRISAHLVMTSFSVEDRGFDRLSADLDASSSQAAVRNGILTRKALQAQFAGSLGLRHWNAGPDEPLNASLDLRNADVADVMALAGEKDIPASGALNASARISGTLGNPVGKGSVAVTNGSVYDEPFDGMQAELELASQSAKVSSFTVTSGPSRMDLSAVYEHPRDSFETGQLQVQVKGNQIDLARIHHLQDQDAGFAGSVQFNANVSAQVGATDEQPRVTIRTVNVDASAKDLRDSKQKLGSFSANARTTGANADFRVESDFAGSTILVSGQTALTKDYPTTADVRIHGLEVERVLLLTGRTDLRVRGSFSLDGRVSGTFVDPRGDLNFGLDKAIIYDEPIDQARGTIHYSNDLVEIPSLRIAARAGEVSMNASFSHQPGDFENGKVQIHIASSGVQLDRIHNLQRSDSTIAGAAKLLADASAEVRTQGDKRDIRVTKLDGNAGANGIMVNKQSFGSATLSAETQGSSLSVRLDSDFAKSTIHGNATAQLTGDYPFSAKLTFANVAYSNLHRFMGDVAARQQQDLDGLAEGQVTSFGMANKPDEIRGELQISKLEVSTAARGAAGRTILLSNQGPITAQLDRSVINVTSARISGRSADISATGTVSLKDTRPLNLRLNASLNLSLLQDLDRDIYSSGDIALAAIVRGDTDQPVVNGKLELKKASLNIADSPNGISNANGVIQLNGTSARIEKLTAESGGGKINLTGFAAYTGSTLRYGLRAGATRIRTRLQGVSVTADAGISLSGTSEHSALTGDVTVQRIAYNPRSDFGSILAGSGTPVEIQSTPSGLLAGMRLDIRIRTSPTVRFQTTLAQRLQAEADLVLQGTLANPGMTGRITVTEGQLVFFGNEYAVNRGVVSFYDPLKIEPVLDFSLETQAQGADVTLGVSGPIENMKLSYRSDPPLQFDEIVALLATGKTPTSDPTIAAHQPAPPQQSVAQMGESAIVSQAVASPLANRLQRVFGVSQLKIDPTFASGSALPQARVTLQQQVSNNITFTYTQDLTESNSQIIRVEWAFTPRFSAVATRDEYGIFGIDFFVKKRFR